MAVGSKIVGMWPRGDASDEAGAQTPHETESDAVPGAETATDRADALPSSDDPLANDPPWSDAEWDADTAPRRAASLAALAIAVLAIAWVGFYGWTKLRAGFATSDPAIWVDTTIDLSIPLILLTVLYLVVQRSSTAEAQRYGSLMRDLDVKTAALQDKLVGVNQYLAAAHRQLREDGDRLSTLGLDVGARIHGASEQIRGDMAAAVIASDHLADRSGAAFAQVEGLLAGLPRVDAVAARLTDNLSQAGLAAHKHGSALQAQIAALHDEAERSGEALAGSSDILATRITGLSDASLDLAQRLDLSRGGLVEAIGDAMTQLETAIGDARLSAQTEIAALVGEAEAARDRLAAAAGAMTAETRDGLDACDTVVIRMGERLAAHRESADALAAGLDATIAQSDEAMTALDADWTTSLGAVSAVVGDLTEKASAMTTQLADGETVARGLLARSEDLMLALDSVAREIDETMPRALARLDSSIDHSRGLVDEVAPTIESMEALGVAALASLKQSHGLLAAQGEEAERQRALMGDLAATNAAALADMKTLIADIETGSAAVADAAAPRLVEAMVRVKESAGQAIAHARSALASVIDDAGERMRTTTREGLSAAVDAGIEQKIAGIAAVSERAVAAARIAADRLMEQVAAIAETSAAIEYRVAEARNAAEATDAETLSRHVALLTESLKSTAIDVTKILSNEVTDTAWAAYLKGDRSVFTRRAVRLLDATEAREILGFYENDADFRDYVNRYIHDFEAMLRTLLGTRDGRALSVTLLSSDMGKLYVALAQAIERLRG